MALDIRTLYHYIFSYHVRKKRIDWVGAGPTGLTLSLALDMARRGVSCRIIEAAETPFKGSRGKGIQPRTLEIFEDLGIVEPIVAAGGLYPKLRIHLGPLSMCAGSMGSSKPPTESVPYPNLWMLPQSRTEEIMRERLRNLGGRVEFGTALVSFDQDTEGVNASLSTGERVRVDFLAGCDGGRSVVRKILGLKLEARRPSTKSQCSSPTSRSMDSTTATGTSGSFVRSGMIGLCPLPGTSLFQLTAKAETIDGDIESVVQKATGHRVARVAWSSIYQPAVRMVNRYRTGRVFLAGDAAHVHPRL